MHRRTFVAAATAFAAGWVGARGRRRPAGRAAPMAQRGIAYDGYGGTPSPGDFAALRALGATHVALFPFGYMESYREPEVFRFTGPGTDVSLTDDGLLLAAGLARDAGLEVIVVPTLEDFRDGHWRGEVRMASERQWASWFASYGAFLRHYAALAARMGAAGLSVGTELRGTVHRTGQWRTLIGETRRLFPGWLTYAANWDDYHAVPWWPAVDLIGVQAYFALGDPGPGSLEARTAFLERAWAPHRDRLAAASRTHDRPVLFTEIGYKSHSGATAEPWRWDAAGDPDPDLQAAAYEATFRTFRNQPWFAGLYWWKWHAADAPVPDRARNFTPQGKAATNVIRRYYGGAPR